MEIKYTIPLLLTIFLFSCTSKKAFNKKIRAAHSAQEQKADLNIVKHALEKNHPGLYWYISQKELDFKFDSLSKVLKDSPVLCNGTPKPNFQFKSSSNRSTIACWS